MSFFSEQPKGYCQYDYIEEDSDGEQRCGRDSSEDELDILLHGTPEQKRRLTRSISRGSLEMSSSEDEFEKEMEKELDEAMRQHEQQFAIPAEGTASSSQASCSGPSAGQANSQAPNTDRHPGGEFYDDIYFDSDDETQEGVATGEAGPSQKSNPILSCQKSPGKHRVPTNDELLYDPDIDEENQQWVNKQRQCYYPTQSAAGAAGSQVSDSRLSADTEGEGAKEGGSIPKSDAVLNCPACLTTLCLDCQRHELYTHQYRAMFVLNCTIVRSERLTYAVPQNMGRGKKWRKKKHQLQMERTEAGGSSSSGTKQEEHFHPVRCSTCNTEVAVYDTDEVFHFFNVLTSLA